MKNDRGLSSKILNHLPLTSTFTRNPFLSSFLLNLFLTCAGLLFFKPYFFTDDDPFTILVAKGMGIAASPSEFIFYTNIIHGLFLKYFYGVFPGIPWHGAAVFTAFFSGSWAYFLSVFYSTSPKIKIILSVLCFFCVNIYFLINPHYTSASILACLGGCFLLSSLSGQPGVPKGPAALMGACFLLSFLIRPKAFFLGTLVALPLFFPLLLPQKRKPLGKNLILGLGLSLALISGAALTDHFYYQKNQGWNDFKKLFPTLMSLFDFPSGEMGEREKSVLAEMGWSLNDLNLQRNWVILDREKFSPENLEKLDHSRKISNPSPTHPFPYKIIFENTVSQFIFFFLLGTAAFIPFKRIPAFAFMLFWFSMVYTCLFYFMKTAPWVFLPAMVSLPYLAIHFSEPLGKGNISPKAGSAKTPAHWLNSLLWVLLGGMAATVFSIYFFTNQIQQKNESEVKNAILELKPQNDQLYVAWHNTIPYQAVNAFDDFKIFRKFHVFALHEYERTPVGEEVLKQFGVKNLFLEMVDNPKLFMICEPYEWDLYLNCMRENYRISVTPKKVFGCSFFNVYQVHSLKGLHP